MWIIASQAGDVVNEPCATDRMSVIDVSGSDISVVQIIVNFSFS